MLTATIFMGVLALVLVLIGWWRGVGAHIVGLTAAILMTLQIAPMLIFAFIVAGMIPVLVPKAALARWVGHESGLRGLLVGTLAGAAAPGGPYVSLPLAGALLRGGASMGTMVAFVTAWSLWAFGRLPMEFAIMGWKFTVVRFLSVFFFPPVAGFIANLIALRLRL